MDGLSADPVKGAYKHLLLNENFVNLSIFIEKY